MSRKKDEAEAADTPARLVQAAVDVLEHDGDGGIRVREVASAAGVTYSAVQFHFGGKDGLVEAAYLELYRRELMGVLPVIAAQIDAAGEDTHFADLMRSIAPLYFNPQRAEARRRRAQVLGASVTRPALGAAVADVHRQFFEGFAEAIEPARQHGWIRADVDARAMAAIFIGVVNARVLVENDPAGVDLADWDHAAVTALLAFTTD